MHEILQYSQSISTLTKEAVEDLVSCTSEKTYKKGKYVLRHNQICRQIYFINAGLLKCFFVNGNKEFVMRFFSENIMFSMFDSFISQTPSQYTLIALEDTTITGINFDSMMELCKKHHCIETLFRKLISVANWKMTKRIREMLESDATNRYRLFIKDNNHIIQRLNMGDIAKYLGITQQSLSRIRAAK